MGTYLLRTGVAGAVILVILMAVLNSQMTSSDRGFFMLMGIGVVGMLLHGGLHPLGREARTVVIGTFVLLVLINELSILYLFILDELFILNLSSYGPPQIAAWTIIVFTADNMALQFGVCVKYSQLLTQRTKRCLTKDFRNLEVGM